uniref:Uncharacterized protein n=1 Tax=Ananas comosus var. bracteatus TaxID=296719 RepID=A0A6V7NWH5_ANACO|nr:unnamed protein product [Ananas comosus var. bracteatus]
MPLIAKAFCIAFVMTFFSVFDVPAFWTIRLCYWIILFYLIMKCQILYIIKYKYVQFNTGKQVTTGLKIWRQQKFSKHATVHPEIDLLHCALIGKRKVPTLDPVRYSPREECRDDERPRMMTLEVCAHDGSSDSADEGSNQPGSKTSAVNSLRQDEPNGEGKPRIRLRDEPNG